ncbi:PREDICTED: leucine-rich [Prunus dulcis]|uniref:PREDICTED: leucine-rich n=2 Tax=Prunus dulcis TaxID=3755 RepID=A0A5E4FTK8_PRUDU|nr:uncharacterized protein LOC117614546 isoform X1 [Prunus dulcis]VVA30845.1 PREDICTED: leucine-rich [Prunus dulcis]
MTKFSCFSVIVRRKKKVQRDYESARPVEVDKAIRTLQVRLQQQPVKHLEIDGTLKPATLGVLIPYGVEKKYTTPSGKARSPYSPIGFVEAAFYEGEDEHEGNPLERENCCNDCSHLQTPEANSGEVTPSGKMDLSESDSGDRGVDRIQSGHLSDPGIGKAEFWASPKLTRSCSNLETHHTDVVKKMSSKLPASKSQYFEELHELADSVTKYVDPGSPGSVLTHFTADKVMLKKHSSSQVLPSRSRKLWWKLFLWSHRNLHKTRTAKQKTPSPISLNKQGGYSSDTLEPNRAMQFVKMESPLSCTGESLNKGKNIADDNKSWDGFNVGGSALWPQNQWVAFSADTSSSTRVQEWVKDLKMQPSENNEYDYEGLITPPTPPTPETPQSPVSPETTRSKSATYFSRGLDEDTLHANTVIQTLNSSTTVAHISGMGLKAIPNISCLGSLRSINLSNNFLAHITPGSLPKSLHTLNLSKNKISTIEGLRDLTRLRVLDVSYNRISRVGRGLSSCTLIKELYLTGNKISDVEGLHRLLKLTVLDLSFNKITTTKAMGQMVANYNSLQALNLLGNPIQNNISDEQLRKAVCSFLPKLMYLNKQSIKPQRAREVLTNSVAKAALGNKGWSPRRKDGKRLNQKRASLKKPNNISPRKTSSLPIHGHKSGASDVQKNIRKSKSISIAALPSSSH